MVGSPFYLRQISMDLLSAVNGVLPVLGEHPVTSTTQKHPTLAILLPIIDRKIDEECARGWWFNVAHLKLFPDSEKKIAVPIDTLAFLPDCEGPVVRGNQLFNMETQSYDFDAPVEGELTSRREFNELPESMAQYIFYSSLVQAYLTDIGLENVVSEWKELMDTAEANATKEHLRNKRYSTMRSPRFQRLRRAMRA